jgi:hypothetical protein
MSFVVLTIQAVALQMALISTLRDFAHLGMAGTILSVWTTDTGLGLP